MLESEKRLEDLRISLRNPHPKSVDLAELGFADWSERTTADSDLVEPSSGRKVSWREAEGWVYEE
jgi:hypothetical protein